MSKKKNNKYQFFKNFGIEPTDGTGEQVILLQSNLRNLYINKFYNLWMNRYTWKGLDEEMAAQEQNFIMRKLWAEGTCACFPIKNTELMGFTTWATNTYNMYDCPETVSLINLRGVSANIIPTNPQVVNKDVVLFYAQPNHKGIGSIVSDYVSRIVQVDLIVNINLQLQKMPFLITVDESDKDKMKDVVKRILKNETVIFTDAEALQKIQTLATQTPYVIDKLSAYRADLEKELLTFLGIDNNGSSSLEQTHISMDAVNATNGMIGAYGDAIYDEITRGLNDINRVFGRDIHIEKNEMEVASIHEELNGKDEEKEAGGSENDD